MRKFFFFAILSLAFLCCVSCNHPASSGFDFSDNNPVDRINGTITSDGTSITVSLPAFPSFSAARDAENPEIHENQHFVVTLQSCTVSEESRSLEGCAGETVTFENITPGDYIISCKAWDDITGLCFEGNQTITVKEGNNPVILEMNFYTEDEHIKLEPTDDGVKITIKGIDFDKTDSISVFDYTGASDVISPFFGFELDDEKAAEIEESGSEYSFIWPFAPLKVNGQNRGYYVFQYQHVDTSTGALVQELVCCATTSYQYSLKLADYNTIESDYYTNLAKKTREVSYRNMTLDTLRSAVTNTIPVRKISSFRAILETWAGDFVHGGSLAWVTDKKVLVDKAGDFTDESSFFYELSKGNAVDLLTYSDKDAREVNEMLCDAEYGNNITPNFRWQFSVEGIPNGWFQLPPIKKMDYCAPFAIPEKVHAVDITNGQTDTILLSDNGKPVLTVEQMNGNFQLTVNVPENTKYMQIEDVKTGNSYHFTSKQGETGNLVCSGQEVTIPWAFYGEAGEAQFKICYTYSDSYMYREGSATISSDSITGADFEFNEIDCKGAPQLGTDVVIDADTFKVKMPSEKSIDDYTLAFKNTPPFIIQKTFIVYSLNFLNGSYDTYDIRLDITDDGNNFIRDMLCTYQLNIKANEMELYYCNNDETVSNGFAAYSDMYADGVKTIEGIYQKTGLSGNPAMYTTGGLAFRLLDRDSNYYDSGFSDKWYGEYRISLWSHEWEYNGDYPAPANQ